MATSYTNPLGSGYRTPYLTALASTGLLAGGSGPLLVNGVFTDNVFFANNVAVAGRYFQFDFGSGNTFVIDEAKFYQSGTQSHGVWKWQGSLNGTDWTDIGSSFTLGGATTQYQTQLNGNTNAYRYYRLLGVSGNGNWTPYLREFEFSIGFVDTTGSSYLRKYGTGIRTALITVATNITCAGSIDTIKDGVQANVLYFTTQTAVDKYLSFDFSEAITLTEATWTQHRTESHGTWKWQGSSNNTDWTDIGSSFTLGGATTQYQTELNGNTTAYRYYRLLGVSGNINSGPYIYEVDFKILPSTPAPPEWIPPGQDKPPKTDPGGGKSHGGRESQKEIREYRWRYLRSDAQGRYVAESSVLESYEPVYSGSQMKLGPFPTFLPGVSGV